MRSVTPITRKMLRQVRLHGLLADPRARGRSACSVGPSRRVASTSCSRSESPSSGVAALARARGARSPRAGRAAPRPARRRAVPSRSPPAPRPSGGSPTAPASRAPQDLVAIREGRQHDDGHVRLASAAIAPGRRDAVEHRHLEVHEHDVGLRDSKAELDGLRPLAAAPTSSTSSNVARRLRRGPLRTTAWSSAIRTSDHAGGTSSANDVPSSGRRADIEPAVRHAPRAPREARGRRGPRLAPALAVVGVRSRRRRPRSRAARPRRRRFTETVTRCARGMPLGVTERLRGGPIDDPLGIARRGRARGRPSSWVVRRPAHATARARSPSAASSPLARRFGGWMSTRRERSWRIDVSRAARPHAARVSRATVDALGLRCGARASMRSRQDPGRRPSWSSAAIRRRSSAEASTARTSNASRSAWRAAAACGRGATRAGTWTTQRRTRLAEEERRERHPDAAAGRRDGAPALVGLEQERRSVGGADRQVDLVQIALPALVSVLGACEIAQRRLRGPRPQHVELRRRRAGTVHR